MHEIAPINPWVALAYLVAGVFFILALRGLSSPASSQRGNRFGIVGMTIAVVTTLLTHIPFDNVFPTPGVPAHDTSGLDFAALGEILAAIAIRSEERRVGKECGSTCRYGWSPYH